MSPISRAGPVCLDDFQPGFSMNDSSTNDLDHLFPAIWWSSFCTYAAGWATLPLHPIEKGYIDLFGRISCSEEKFDAGPFSSAGPVNAITWKIFSPVSRDSGIAIPGSRLTGLARLSCNREVDFVAFNRRA